MNNKNNCIKYLLEDEKERLFDNIATLDNRYIVRNRALFYIAKYCALRVSEVTQMKVTQLDLNKYEIYCIRNKNGNSNTLKIIDDTVKRYIDDYMNYREILNIKSEFLFTSQKNNNISRKTLDRIMKHYCELSNIPEDKRHFHTLRHTRAIELAELGLDTKEIQFWLGHKNITNTEIYFQFTTRQQISLYNKLGNNYPKLDIADKNALLHILKTYLS